MTAALVPPRPVMTFGTEETVTFMTEQAARAYIGTRVCAHFRAQGSGPEHPAYTDVADNVTAAVYDGVGATVSLRGIESLVHSVVATVLYF